MCWTIALATPLATSPVKRTRRKATATASRGCSSEATVSLYETVWRQYDPTTGKWTTMDPSGLGPDSNPYRVEGNGPTDATDPTGLEAINFPYLPPKGENCITGRSVNGPSPISPTDYGKLDAVFQQAEAAYQAKLKADAADAAWRIQHMPNPGGEMNALTAEGVARQEEWRQERERQRVGRSVRR